MRKTRTDWSLPVAFVVSGITIGAMSMLLLSHGWTAEWVETVGTWFGGVATVLTLLWAIRVFRADQIQRLRADRDALHADAATVGVTTSVLGASGGPDERIVDALAVRIFNDSRGPIWIRRLEIPQVTVRKGDPTPLRLSPGEQWSGHVDFHPIRISEAEFQSQEISKLSWTVVFEANGISWTKTPQNLHRSETTT